jgi:peptide/nickel transport system permease protein
MVSGIMRRRQLARWRIALGRAGNAAVIYIAFLGLIALVGSIIALQDPNVQNLAGRNQPPSPAHPFGTDLFGRDVLSRLIVGAQVTLTAAAIALAISIVIGVPAGLVAGHRGGWFDSVFSRVADALMGIPPLIIALAIVGIAGAGLRNAMVAIGIVLSPRFFRVARGSAIKIGNEIYIEAARADGCSTTRLLVRHVLPNASGPLLVQSSFALGFIITAEASLSFLGLGVQPPTATWGSMLREAFSQVSVTSFQIIPPSVLITLTVLASSVLGDAIRDAMVRTSERA